MILGDVQECRDLLLKEGYTQEFLDNVSDEEITMIQMMSLIIPKETIEWVMNEPR